MPNVNQNNNIRSINKEISLLQDSLNINENRLNEFKNGLRRIGRLQLKQAQKTNIFKTKKIQEAFRDIFNSKIKTVKKKNDRLKMHL